MVKKGVSIILALLVVLTCFAACERKYKHGLLITDNKGKSYILATDKQGEIITDKAGNVAVLITNENGRPSTDEKGDQKTNFQSPPVYYTSGNVVEGEKFSVAIPKGWQLGDSEEITLKQKATGGELYLLVKENQTLKEAVSSLDDVLKQASTSKTKYTVENVKKFGVNVTKYNYKDTKNDVDMVIYMFEKNKTVFMFRTTNKIGVAGKVDYETLMNTIKFK